MNLKKRKDLGGMGMKTKGILSFEVPHLDSAAVVGSGSGLFAAGEKPCPSNQAGEKGRGKNLRAGRGGGEILGKKRGCLRGMVFLCTLIHEMGVGGEEILEQRG